MEEPTKDHIGVVTQIGNNDTIRVKIASNQCDGCKMGELCGISSENEISVFVSGHKPAIGERVIVTELRNLEVKAILWCLAIPCIIFLTVVMCVSAFFTTPAGCLSGLVALAVYFIVYYVIQGRKEPKKVNFKIKEI